MTPDEAAHKIIEILEQVQGGWQEEVEASVSLRGFYLCADYGNFKRDGVFFCVSGDGSGEELTPWAVEGMLSYALKNDLYGLEEEDEDFEE